MWGLDMMGNGWGSGWRPEFLLPALIVPLAIWSLAWKGMALWVAARRGHTVWFIVFLVINLVGILEIFYLLTTKGFDELQSKNKS
jgi:hypothetical protein